jgi:large subunit ribosomal protein L41
MIPDPSSSTHSFYTQLKPYVSLQVRLTRQEERAAIGRFRGSGGFTGQHMLRAARAAESKNGSEVAKVEGNVS